MPTLDTSVIIDLLRGHASITRVVERAVEAGRTLYVAPHSLFELYRGAYSQAAPAAEFLRVEQALA